ncbi:ABC transporter substrate-binding protein [Luteimicrobium album]|uniref:ABC transporter substrate-binding protein n=2 Tax=Luteimicrobium album TaxID=1054550 RepID=A0ABQ6HVN8_9MICO|nr:ABC transporter substrate-binding protein [Luteimicrobium album]
MAASAVAGALVTLTACANGVSPEGSRTGTRPATEAKIGLLLPDSVTPRYSTADYPLFKAAVAERCPRCQVLYQNAAGSAAAQQQQAQAMITQDVSVLVLDPFDRQAAAAIVTQARAKGIPVIAYDRLVDSGGLAAYVSFDNEKIGELQARSLVDRMRALGLPDDAGILEINGSPTDNNARLYQQGARNVLKTTGYRVLGSFDTPGWDPIKAQQWASGQIAKVGADEIKGVYAANDDLAAAAISALQSAGVATLPPVTGQDASLAGLQRVIAGEQYMTVYKAFKPEATKAAELALDLAAGKSVSLPTTATTATGQVVPAMLLDTVPVTADDIADTVVKDGVFTVEDLCTAPYAAACERIGLE